MTREEFMDIVYSELHSDGDNYRANRIIDAADEYAEAQTRWIPVSERLPEDAYGCYVTVEVDNALTGEVVPTTLPYLVGYDGETWNDSAGIPIPYEVIAWMPRPKPWKEEE